MRNLSAGILASPGMTLVPPRVLLVLALLAACLGRAAAQPGRPKVVSVDAAVLNAEYVFVGRIERLLTEGSTTSAANVAAKVETRLKGEVSDVTGTMVAAPESSLTGWRARGSRLLFIDGAQPIDLSASNLLVFTAQLAALRQPERVIQAARDAIQQHPGVTRIQTCPRPIPPDLAKKHNLFGNVDLVVPADGALERWALHELRSSDPNQRSQAARVLRHFPSDANVARLKALLADPGFVLCEPAPGDKERKFYIVRESAYGTLIAWGLKIEPPTFYNETSGLHGDAEELGGTNTLMVLVKASKTKVRVGETFDVSLRVENPPPTNQYVLVRGCSWSENWKSDNTNIVLFPQVCAKNTVGRVEIRPGGAYVNQGQMQVLHPVRGNKLSFRMGFTPFTDTSNNPFIWGKTVWSKEVVISIKP